MYIFKSNHISRREKKALCEYFGILYPQDLTRTQLERLANSLPGCLTLLRIRLYNLGQRYIKEFKKGKARAQNR